MSLLSLPIGAAAQNTSATYDNEAPAVGPSSAVVGRSDSRRTVATGQPVARASASATDSRTRAMLEAMERWKQAKAEFAQGHPENYINMLRFRREQAALRAKMERDSRRSKAILSAQSRREANIANSRPAARRNNSSNSSTSQTKTSSAAPMAEPKLTTRGVARGTMAAK
jgi:hypothetical protein